MSKQVRIGLFIAGLIALFFSGWQLATLRLWEYWSLVFLGSLWACVLLFLSLGKKSTRKSRRRLFISSVSGVLLALSFPPFPFPFLAFIALVPLLLLWEEIKSEQGNKPLTVFWWYAYNTFVIWNVIATFWVSNSALLPGIFAIWVNALFMTIPFLLSAWSSMRLSRNIQWLVWVMPWVAFEYGHLNWELSWPWLTLGHAFANVPSLIQWYSIVGVLGGSLWVLSVNYLITQHMKALFLATAHKKGFTFPALVILIPVVGSLIQYYSFQEQDKTVNFSILQPNYEPHYEKFDIAPSIQLREILELMDAAVTDSTDYVLLPETVFDNFELTDFQNQSAIVHIDNWLNSHKGMTVILGLASYTIIDEAEKDAYTRSLNRQQDTLYYRMQNSAVAFDEGQVEAYYKSKFVPGAEIFPYSRYLFFLKPLVDMLGGSTVGFEPQERPSIFTLGPTKVAPLICYESVYPEYAASFMRAGAEVIAIMTNDGWWGNTFGYKQHNAFARIMAIEMRRDVVRSANSGISSVINARGDVLAATQYDERTFINASVSERTELTFYAQWGSLIGKIAAILVFILMCLNLLSYFRKEKSIDCKS